MTSAFSLPGSLKESLTTWGQLLEQWFVGLISQHIFINFASKTKMGRLCHTHFFSYSFHTFPLSAFSYLTFIQPFFSNPERCNTHTHNCVCVSCNVLGSPLFGSADAWSSLVNVKQTCSNKRGPNLDLNQFLGYVLCPLLIIVLKCINGIYTQV